jgi:large subunit ribosomal protein L6
MSRIGKKPIDLPENVSINFIGNNIVVKGTHGILEQPMTDFIKVNIENNKVYLSRTNETAKARAFHGLLRALIQNMITGVTKKFSQTLLAEGVGYKFQLEKNVLFINVGFSHPIKFLIPSDIEIKLESPIKILITGINKEKVGFLADKIRSTKPPEPYKGKGILYSGEIIKRKAGKTGK